LPVAWVFEGGSTLFDGYERLKENHFGTERGDSLVLNPFETVYLAEEGEIEPRSTSGEELSVEELVEFFEERVPRFRAGYAVYRDLVERGYVVKAGFKYGGLFRVYEGDPDREHSKYVVRVVEPSESLAPRDILRATRLAHSVRKEFILAVVEDPSKPKIRYVRWRWRRL